MQSKIWINQSLSFGLAIIILLTMSGFHVYSHQCKTHRTTTLSVIIPSAKCTKHEQQEMLQSCCTNQKEESLSSDTCCSDSQIYLKLKSKVQAENIFYSPQIACRYRHLPEFFTCIDKRNDLKFNLSRNEIPPPLLVNEYLSKIQVYIL